MKIDEVYECPACGHQSRLTLANRPDPDEKVIECEGCLYTGPDKEFEPEAEDDGE